MWLADSPRSVLLTPKSKSKNGFYSQIHVFQWQAVGIRRWKHDHFFCFFVFAFSIVFALCFVCLFVCSIVRTFDRSFPCLFLCFSIDHHRLFGLQLIWAVCMSQADLENPWENVVPLSNRKRLVKNILYCLVVICRALLGYVLYYLHLTFFSLFHLIRFQLEDAQ